MDSGAVLNDKDKNGHTPLHLVALDGSERTAVWLRRHGADLRARNDVSQTPLDLVKSRLAKTKSDANEGLVKCLDWDLPTPDSEDSGCVLMHNLRRMAEILAFGVRTNLRVPLFLFI